MVSRDSRLRMHVNVEKPSLLACSTRYFALLFLNRSGARTEAMAKTRKSNEMGWVRKTVGVTAGFDKRAEVGL